MKLSRSDFLVITKIKNTIREAVSLCLFLALTFVTAYSAYGQAFRYESKGKRDPFVSLIGSEKVVKAGLEDIMSIEDINLEGIAIGAGGKRVAVINGQIMKENEKKGNLVIKRITDTKVTLSIDEKDYSLSLPEEGGGMKSAK